MIKTLLPTLAIVFLGLCLAVIVIPDEHNQEYSSGDDSNKQQLVKRRWSEALREIIKGDEHVLLNYVATLFIVSLKKVYCYTPVQWVSHFVFGWRLVTIVADVSVFFLCPPDMAMLADNWLWKTRPWWEVASHSWLHYGGGSMALL